MNNVDEVRKLPDNNSLAAMRTVMASERTFLAWCRTALALMGFGFVLEKFIWYLQHTAGLKPDDSLHDMGVLSLSAFGAGGIIMILALSRFFIRARQVGLKSKKFGFAIEVILVLSVAIILSLCFLAGSNLAFYRI